ncbi:MAG: methyl-accepting chemotaxis protein [Thermomicrobium sp.]|nr:methyl-accepting chemotaxis protein [Thermomicrobium sp.]
MSAGSIENGNLGTMHSMRTRERVGILDGNGVDEANWVAALEELAAALARGDLLAAEQAVMHLPPAMQTQWSGVVAAWHDRIAELLVAASGAVAEGLRPVRAADEFSRAFREQKEQLGQAANVARELAQAVELVFGSVGQVSDAARGAAERAEAGIGRVDEALRALAAVARSVSELQNRIEELSKAVNPITQVLGTIATIAKQTNLLALNAAIEAARAGEHGRGFAVVAEEVRRLAVSTQEAVAGIREQVQALSEGMQRVGEAMGVVAEQVENGALVAAGGQEALASIRKSIDAIVAPLHDIASAAEEQAQSVSQLARNVESVAELAESVGKQADELTVGVIEQMQRLRAVRELIAQTTLTLSDAQLVQVAKADHLLWVQRLLAMLHGKEQLQPEQVADWTVCRLGRWYYGRGRERYGHSSAYRQLEQPHQRLHQTAAEAVRAWNRGDRERARELVEEVRRISSEIVSLLDALRTT